MRSLAWLVLGLTLLAVPATAQIKGVPPATDFSDAQPITADWHFSPWLGLYYDHDLPWVYQAQLEWIYTEADDSGGIFLYMMDFGWTWTSRDIFPYFYGFDMNRWYWVKLHSHEPQFYDFQDRRWLHEPIPEPPVYLPPPSGIVTSPPLPVVPDIADSPDYGDEQPMPYPEPDPGEQPDPAAPPMP